MELTITTANSRSAWVDLKSEFNINADDRHLTLSVGILAAAIPSGAASVALLWTPDDGTTAYEVHRGTSPVVANIPSSMIKAGLVTVFDTHDVIAASRLGGKHALEFLDAAGAVKTPAADTAVQLFASAV